MKQKSLYVILDKTYCPDLTLEKAARMCSESGADFIQYRNKTASPEEQFHEARQVAQALKEVSTLFIVNDDPQLALEVDADGVHLGQEDCSIDKAREILGKRKIVGISTHNLEEALSAEKEGADYIAVGDLFGSGTKQNTESTSLETLKEIAQAVKVPIVGIGGITLENKESVFEAGATAVAVSKSLLTSPEITQTCGQFKI